MKEKDNQFDNCSPGCISREDIQRIKEITWLGVIVNLCLSVLKLIGGIIGQSHALIADSIHSFSDLTTDFAVLFGVKYWSRPADSNHPYGHRRIETIITSAIGLTLLLVGLSIGYNSLVTIRHENVSQPKPIAFVLALISIIVKEILYRWTSREGKRVKSSAVIANAWHHRSDAFSSIPVAITIIIAALNKNWSFLDHIGAIVVSIFIAYTAWGIMKSSIYELSDRAAEGDICDMIEKIASSVLGVKSVHAIRTRRMGSGILADLHITVNDNITVKEGHDISENVKHSLIEKGTDILDVVIHLEPHRKHHDNQ